MTAGRAGRVERWIFFVATSVIAVRVLDDNFIQPEVGTGAGDHLLSGLVPLACWQSLRRPMRAAAPALAP